MILLLYVKTYFNTIKLDLCVPSVYVSLLLEFEDVFSNEIPSRFLLIKGIKHRLIWYHVQLLLIDQSIQVILRKQMSYKGKWRS